MPPKTTTRSELAELDDGKSPIPHRSSTGGTSSGFIDIDKLRDASGLVVVISQRRSNGVMTMGLFKEFERDGRVERTSFIPEPLFDAAEQLTKLARERIAKIHADGDEPLPAIPASRSR